MPGCLGACTWAKLAMLDGVGDILLLAEASWGAQVNLHVDDCALAAAGHAETEVCEAAVNTGDSDEDEGSESDDGDEAPAVAAPIQARARGMPPSRPSASALPIPAVKASRQDSDSDSEDDSS